MIWKFAIVSGLGIAIGLIVWRTRLVLANRFAYMPLTLERRAMIVDAEIHQEGM